MELDALSEVTAAVHARDGRREDPTARLMPRDAKAAARAAALQN